MIKHIVMWNIRGDTPDQKSQGAQFLKSRFGGLIGKIPGLLLLEVGTDTSGVEHACDVVLYTEFESQQALDVCARHPAHERVKKDLAVLRTARYQVDYAPSADFASESENERAAA